MSNNSAAIVALLGAMVIGLGVAQYLRGQREQLLPSLLIGFGLIATYLPTLLQMEIPAVVSIVMIISGALWMTKIGLQKQKRQPTS